MTMGGKALFRCSLSVYPLLATAAVGTITCVYVASMLDSCMFSNNTVEVTWFSM